MMRYRKRKIGGKNKERSKGSKWEKIREGSGGYIKAISSCFTLFECLVN